MRKVAYILGIIGILLIIAGILLTAKSKNCDNKIISDFMQDEICIKLYNWRK